MSEPTLDDLKRRAQHMARYGARKRGPVTDLPGEASAEADGDLFSVRDLLVHPFSPERFAMPNGKAVWVHAPSAVDVVEFTERAVADVRAMHLTDQGLASALVQGRCAAWQVVLVCRQGPELDAARIFPEKGERDAVEAILRNPGWVPTINRIVAISNGLVDDQETQRREVLAGFFGALAGWVETCASRWSMDSPAASVLSQFAICVSSMKRRGMPLPADVDLLIALTEELAALEPPLYVVSPDPADE